MRDMKAVVFTGLVFTLLLALPVCAMASGLGVAGSYGAGSLRTDAGSQFGGGSETRYDQERHSVGVVFDSNVGKDKLFNYRLGVSYQKIVDRASEHKLDLEGILVENDFGFGILRNQAVRLWAGPEVRAEYVEGWGNTSGQRFTESSHSLGFGPVAGLNLHLGDDLSLALRGGYIFQTGIRLFSDWNEKFGFVSLGLLFRMGEGAADSK